MLMSRAEKEQRRAARLSSDLHNDELPDFLTDMILDGLGSDKS